MMQGEEATAQQALETGLPVMIDDYLALLNKTSLRFENHASVASAMADCAYTLAILQGRDVSKP